MSRPGGGPRLFLCPTPIGNLEDVTHRVARVLAEVDLIFAEDTRRAAILLRHLGVHTPVRSFYVGNEHRRAEEAVQLWRQGMAIALISDAGSPLLADPGYPLVQVALREGVPVTALPGPTALIPALTGSGLPVVPFRFVGYLPRTSTRRRRLLETLRHDPATLVAYEAPHRLAASLQDLFAVFGDRPACIVRELTKLHETWYRERLGNLSARDWGDVKGEFVLVIRGFDSGEKGTET
jgi:16S rRNA (cytidine1402-2'-O)-methyltransferase